MRPLRKQCKCSPSFACSDQLSALQDVQQCDLLVSNGYVVAELQLRRTSAALPCSHLPGPVGVEHQHSC